MGDLEEDAEIQMIEDENVDKTIEGEEVENEAVTGPSRTKKKRAPKSNGSTSAAKPASVSLRKKEIAHKLLLREYDLMTRAEVKESGDGTSRDWSSPVWDHFLLVRDRQTGALTDGVQCKSCKRIYIYRGNATGTASLRRHFEQCIACKEIDPTVRVDPPASAKHSFTVASAQYCARDLRAPNSFSSPGMENLIQTAIDLTVKHGAMDAKKLIPSPKTVTRHIHLEAEKATAELSEEIVMFVRQGRVAATTDGWTEDHDQEKYYTLTLHYIDENGVLRNRVATTINITVSCTAENLLSFILEQLEKININPDDARKIIFVTDGGSDIVKALEDGGFTRIYCAAHALNIIVRTTLSCKYHEIISNLLEAVPRAGEIVTSCNNWVEEVRKILPKKYKGIREQLRMSNPTAQSHVPTLKCVVRLREKVEKVTSGTTSLLGIDTKEIQELIDFLEPFDSGASREKSASVTTGRVSLLNLHLQPVDSDATCILDVSALKQHAEAELLIMQVVRLLEEMKALVAFLKRTGLNKIFESSAKQEVETRWNTQLAMLKSIYPKWDEIEQVLEEARAKKTKRDANGVPSLDNIDKELVESLIEFLEPFGKHTMKLQGRHYPTLQYVLVSLKVLLVHTAPETSQARNDSPVMAAICARAHKLLLAKIAITDQHKLATLFWPRMKDLLVFDRESERKQVHDLVRVRLQAAAARQRQCPNAEGTDPPPSSSTSSAKRVTDVDLFGMFMLKKSSKSNELERYLLMPESEIGDDEDLLNWWKIQGSVRFPELTKIAMTVLQIPATSSASESGFSDAGRLISDLRTSLLPTTVNDTLVYRNSIMNKEK